MKEREDWKEKVKGVKLKRKKERMKLLRQCVLREMEQKIKIIISFVGNEQQNWLSSSSS